MSQKDLLDDCQMDSSIFSAEDVQKFMRGEITWGQLTGVTREQAYAIADLGFNLFNQGKIEAAKKIFEGLVELNPKDSYFVATLGSILARMGRFEEAISSFNMAVQLGSCDPQLFVNRAEIFLSNGEFKNALADLDYAISLNPQGDHPAVFRARAMAKTTATLIESFLQKNGQNPV